MKKIFANKKSSIQNKLVISYSLLIILIMGIIGVTVYMVAENIIEAEVSNYRLNVLNQVSKNISVIINEIISVSNLYYADRELVNIIRREVPENDFDRLDKYLSVMNILNKNTYSFENINLKYYTVLYGFNGHQYNSWINNTYNFDSIPKRQWYQNILKKDGRIVWISTFNDKEGYGEDNFVFSAARVMKHHYTNKAIGVLLMNIDEAVLYNTYKEILNIGNNIYIVDGNGMVVSSGDKGRLSKKFGEDQYADEILNLKHSTSIVKKKQGKRFLISVHSIPKVGWRIIEEVPLEVVVAPMDTLRNLTPVLFMFCMLMGFILSYIIARHISRPIKGLYNTMKIVEKGELNVTSNVKSTDEIGELSIGFNRMIIRIKELMNSVKREERLKRKAEFDFLQAQINPHFLYNTLYSIKCMVAMKENESAEKMLMSYMNLLRKTLTKQDEFIPIKEELDNLKEYISIQAFRYPDKFEVAYRVDEEILACKTLKLILQPLIENAIFHGIEPKKEKGSIAIYGYREENEVVIKVVDDGIGMDKEQIDAIWEEKNKCSGRAFNQVGIINVHDRLRLHFGEEYGLSIESRLGRGTTVEVRMPYMTVE